mgnify:CR=1 FL=1
MDLTNATKKEIKIAEAIYFLEKRIEETQIVSEALSKQNKDLEKIKKILEEAFTMKDK